MDSLQVHFIHSSKYRHTLSQAGQNSAFDQQLISIYTLNKAKIGGLSQWKK